MNEPVYLEWEILQENSVYFLIGSYPELNFKLMLNIGGPGIVWHQNTEDSFKQLLRYSNNICFDYNFVKSQENKTVFPSGRIFPSILFHQTLYDNPINYLFLVHAMIESKKVVITSEDDILFCLQMPENLFLGFENAHITSKLISNKKVLFFLKANPNKLAELARLAIYENEKALEFPNPSLDYRFSWLLRISNDEEIIARDKNYCIRTLNEMKNWKIEDFRINFELIHRTQHRDFVQKYYVCSELALLKDELDKAAYDEILKSQYSFHLYGFFENGAVSYPYFDPRTNVLIRQVREKMSVSATLILLNQLYEKFPYSALLALETFIENNLFSFPLEWSLPILEDMLR